MVLAARIHGKKTVYTQVLSIDRTAGPNSLPHRLMPMNRN